MHIKFCTQYWSIYTTTYQRIVLRRIQFSRLGVTVIKFKNSELKMKTFNKNLLWVSITALALTGCGGSSGSSGSTDSHDHEHDSSILVSQTGTTTLSLLENGELESLDDAAAGNGATLVLDETGAYAAVLANGTVNFVHGLHEEDHDDEDHEEEAHLLDHSYTGSQVITTGGHFAILNAGTTTFIEYDELENDSPATEDTSSLSVTETYPALMIDEDHELVMAFDGSDAKLYEGTTEEDSFECANPSSHGQTDELVVVTCDEGARAIVIGEDESHEHTFDDSLLTLDGTASNYEWRAQGHVIAGFEPGTSNYAIVELDDDAGEPVVVKGSDEDVYSFNRKVCDIQLDSEEQDVLVLVAGDATTAHVKLAASEIVATTYDGAKLVALNHEGIERASVTINDSAETECADFVMTSASKNALVVDNNAQEAYDIDAHEADSGSVNYHIHSTYELNVSDMADLVVFHEKDEDADHDHDH